MSTTLEVKLRTQAAAFPGLTALLTDSPSGLFRFYEGQLVQGSNLPAIVFQQASNPLMYSMLGRLPTSFARVQFTIWDIDPEDDRAVEAQLFAFLDTFNAIGIPNATAYPVEVLNSFTRVYPSPDPGNWQRIIDVSIFFNRNL